MKYRNLSGEHTLLKIYVGESDKWEHKPLFHVLLEKARAEGMAGCTVLRGPTSFGAGRTIHWIFPVELIADMPIVLELVDTKTKIDGFVRLVEPMLKGALITEEKVIVRHCSHKKTKSEVRHA